MQLFKNRHLSKDEKVKVYFHFRTKKFSVVALEGPFKNKVVAHTNKIKLKDCEFLVNEKQRQEVLIKKSKNVHAYVKGTFEDQDTIMGERAYYNPYLYENFVKGDGTPLFVHQQVSLENTKIYLN
jgi:hypothetical protein